MPYVTVLGTRGGSALAAAALNALGRLALDETRLPSAPGSRRYSRGPAAGSSQLFPIVA